MAGEAGAIAATSAGRGDRDGGARQGPRLAIRHSPSPIQRTDAFVAAEKALYPSATRGRGSEPRKGRAMTPGRHQGLTKR
jgi:hypothetical protein